MARGQFVEQSQVTGHVNHRHQQRRHAEFGNCRPDHLVGIVERHADQPGEVRGC
jgi:hypothetical protein